MPSGWRVDSDLSSPRPASDELLATASEFLASAEQSQRAGRLRAFVENAFHAAESLVKVELLSYPVVAAELEGSRKHPHVQSVLRPVVAPRQHGFAVPAHLRDLNDLRASATYVNKPFALDKQTASAMLGTLRDLASHAEAIAQSTKGRTINLISTRAIAAGELVSSADVRIRPPRKGREPTN